MLTLMTIAGVKSKKEPHMDTNKKRSSVNMFFMSHFSYCPLIWMCHNRTKNSKIDRIHEGCFHLIYIDKKHLLRISHIRINLSLYTIKTLWVKMYKIYRGISPNILNDLFPLRQADQYFKRQFAIYYSEYENLKSSPRKSKISRI